MQAVKQTKFTHENYGLSATATLLISIKVKPIQQNPLLSYDGKI